MLQQGWNRFSVLLHLGEGGLFQTKRPRGAPLHAQWVPAAEIAFTDLIFPGPDRPIGAFFQTGLAVGTKGGVNPYKLKNVKTQETRTLQVNGVFFYVGLKPITGFLGGVVKLDERGYVITDENMATSAPGIFAAGDVRQKLLRQVTTAVGDGATAAFAVERYLESL